MKAICSDLQHASILVLSYSQATSIIFYGKVYFEEEKNLQFDRYEWIVGPVLKKNHWTLFLANTKNSNFYYFNSLKNSLEKNLLEATAFDNWITFCAKIGMKQIIWSLKTINHTCQEDSVNCGPFVCFYFYKVIKKEPLLTDKIEVFREVIYQELLKSTRHDFCVACSQRKINGNTFLGCFHQYHPRCFKKYNIQCCVVCNAVKQRSINN